MISKKEKEVLKYIGSGLTNDEIARVMNITEKTVKFHTGNLYQKLNVRNRVEAALKYHNVSLKEIIMIPDADNS